MIPPPLRRARDGTLHLGPARGEIIGAVQGLALLLCGHRLAEDGTVEPIAGPNLPMPPGNLRGPAEDLPVLWAHGFDPQVQRVPAQILEAATVIPDKAEPLPLPPDHPNLAPRLLTHALARAGSLVCHAVRPLPLPTSPTSAHERLRRICRLLHGPTDPALTGALRLRLAQA